MMFSSADLHILRTLADRVAEAASRPIQREKEQEWRRHNALQQGRPLVFCDPENGWHEILPQSMLQCQDEQARQWEWQLRQRLYWADEMLDDVVVDNIWYVPWTATRTGWGMEVHYVDAGPGGATRWDSPMTDYAMLDQLTFPKVALDHEATHEALAFAREVFDGRLQVVLGNGWWWSMGMTHDVIQLRGLEQMMVDMYDHPDGLHALMKHLSDGNLALLDNLEAQGALFANTDNRYVGSGGFGFTDELGHPEPGHVKAKHMWGFCESQETVLVSPSMFAEFIAPYQRPIMERFGLNCYGCCEPVDKRWHVVKTLPRIRRVSVSAWADVRFMAEALGGNYLFSWKPNPADIAVAHPNWDRLQKEIRETARIVAANGGHLEIIMKDCHTLCVPDNAKRWVKTVREGLT